MVDNRSAGFYGISGSFNFKSGDPSGTAAKLSQEKYGSEAMYMPPEDGEGEDESLYNQPFVDRSALLRATLNSLAMSNVASVLNDKRHKKSIKEILEEDKEKERKQQENREKNEEQNESTGEEKTEQENVSSEDDFIE